MRKSTIRFALAACVALLLTITALLPPTASANCIDDWRYCRRSATIAFFDGEVGVFRLSLLYDACDFGIIRCAWAK